MEEEVRLILQKSIQNNEVEGKIGTRIHSRFKEAGGIEIPEPKRSQKPRKADFE